MGPAVANIFVFSLENVKNKFIKDRSCDLKPVFYIHCVHDILVFFSFLDHVEKVEEYLFPTKSFPQRKKKMVIYLFQASIFFEKKEILYLMFTGKGTSVAYTQISIASYLEPIKPV